MKRRLINAGTSAMSAAMSAAGRSIRPTCAVTGSALPEISPQIGMIKVMSMMFAPMMFPAESDISRLTTAVTVVTSSGSEVPTARTVTAMIRSGTPAAFATYSALSTSTFAPIAIAAAPTRNRITFLVQSRPLDAGCPSDAPSGNSSPERPLSVAPART